MAFDPKQANVFDFKKPQPVIGEVTAWSQNRIKTFEECPFRLYKQAVEKERYESDDNEAATRGIMIHDSIEMYIRSKEDALPEIANEGTIDFIEGCKEKFDTGLVLLEEDWGFDIDWQDIGWFDKKVWGRVKVDAMVFDDAEQTSAIVADWKTGKGSDYAKFKYADQLLTYAIAAFMRFPTLQFVETQIRWVDKDAPPMKQRYVRKQGMQLLVRLNERAMKVTTAKVFPPNPSKSACRFCEYAEHETCDWRYEA